MKDFAVIVKEEIVDKMDLTLGVKEVVGNRIYVCQTLFITPKYTVKDTQGNEYQVNDFLDNEWIEVTPLAGSPDPFNDITVVCPPVYYLHGTPTTVDHEFEMIADAMKEKTPLIWLNENYREREFGRGSSIERETTPQLFFLEETDEEEWKNDEDHRFAVQPMANLATEFAKSADRNRKFKSIEFLEKIPRPRFGVYVDDQGNDRKVIEQDISGVEMQPTLTKYKESCSCY